MTFNIKKRFPFIVVFKLLKYLNYINILYYTNYMNSQINK